MPILPQNRARYPPDWPAISRGVRERAGHRCARCGLGNYSVVIRGHLGAIERVVGDLLPGASFAAARALCERARAAGFRAIVVVLTVAHLNHQPEDCRPENLQALCQRCHNRHDAAHRAETRRATRACSRPLPLLESPPIDAATGEALEPADGCARPGA